jgi:hypothetical protein
MVHSFTKVYPNPPEKETVPFGKHAQSQNITAKSWSHLFSEQTLGKRRQALRFPALWSKIASSFFLRLLLQEWGKLFTMKRF